MATGIPPLLAQPAEEASPVLMVSDAPALTTSQPLWGIYDQNGAIVANPDSIIGLEYKQDWKIADYPMEQGAFQSYNKVRAPFDARVRMTKGGSVSNRADFLSAIQAAAESLDLYTIVTPERTYKSANIAHFNYRRADTNGVGLLTVDIWLAEIRVTVKENQFSNTAAPSGANPSVTGTVQPAETTATPPPIAPTNGGATGSFIGGPAGSLNGGAKLNGMTPVPFGVIG